MSLKQSICAVIVFLSLLLAAGTVESYPVISAIFTSMIFVAAKIGNLQKMEDK